TSHAGTIRRRCCMCPGCTDHATCTATARHAAAGSGSRRTGLENVLAIREPDAPVKRSLRRYPGFIRVRAEPRVGARRLAAANLAGDGAAEVSAHCRRHRPTLIRFELADLVN